MVSLASPIGRKRFDKWHHHCNSRHQYRRWLIDILEASGESFCSITARFGTVAIIGDNEAFTAAIEIVFNNTIALALFASMPDLTCVDSLQGDAIQRRAIGVGNMDAQQTTAAIAIFSLRYTFGVALR